MICVDFAENALLATLASFADSKLLDFSRASDSLALRINGTLCVVRNIYGMYIFHGACVLGTVDHHHHCHHDPLVSF